MSKDEVPSSEWLRSEIANSFRQARLGLDPDPWEGGPCTGEDWHRADRLIRLLAGQDYLTRKGLS